MTGCETSLDHNHIADGDDDDGGLLGDACVGWSRLVGLGVRVFFLQLVLKEWA